MAPAGARGDALAEPLAAALGGKIEALKRLSGGASRSTYSFTLVGSDGTSKLILQVQRTDPLAHDPQLDQARLLRAAAAAGVPVPGVLAAGQDDGFGSPWLVMAHVDGETIGRKLVRDDAFANARRTLARRCGEVLAAIHSIPLDDVGVLGEKDQLDDSAGLLHMLRDQPRPALELGLRWLALRRPAPGRRTLVHGDFRTGNLIVDPTGLQAVIDWELAHVGDPIEDLGWFCVPAWRFGGTGRAGGFGPAEDFVASYEEASGTKVDLQTLAWWEALGTLKWAVICLLQASAHLGGFTRSVELATIGRRTCENEWDLLGLMGAVAPDDSRSAADPKPTMFGRPTAAELSEAVEEYLRTEVMEQTEGRIRFQTRIAANAIGMVGRELRLGPAFQEAHDARLASLGFEDDATLAAAIAAGECDDRIEEIASALLVSARDQLLVSNPKYLEANA